MTTSLTPLVRVTLIIVNHRVIFIDYYLKIINKYILYLTIDF